jgi:hypothetical protein
MLLNIIKCFFGSSGGVHFNLDSSLWENTEQVSGLDNWELTKPFTKEEVKNPLFQMEVNKAVGGPDSIRIEFYQACCDFIAEDVSWIYSMNFIWETRILRTWRR